MTVSIGPSLIAAVGLAGNNGAGAISAPGVKVGDHIITVFLVTPSVGISQQSPGTFTEAIVSVDDEIQQLDSSNLTGRTVNVFLSRLP